MSKILAENRRAWHDYSIIETYEAGIELKGTEAKSCRMRNISIGDAFAKCENGEIFLYNCHIAPYELGGHYNHDPLRPRKLLLRSSEIRKITQALKEKGLTLIPLKLYLKNGFVKLELASAKGKTKYDKREKLRREEDKKLMRKMIGMKR
jgi:SsrA-binding protein